MGPRKEPAGPGGFRRFGGLSNLRVCALLLVAGCGRLGFSPSDNGDGGTDPLSTSNDALVDAAPLVCAASYTLSFGTSKYRRSTANRTWFLAEADCEADGGHVVFSDDLMKRCS